MAKHMGVNPETRELVTEFGGQIEYFLLLEDHQEIVFDNGLEFMAIGGEGECWKTERLSWDGMRSIIQTGNILSGEGYNAMTDSWYSFSVNLDDGKSEGGAYP
jgi:hypothetical protein